MIIDYCFETILTIDNLAMFLAFNWFLIKYFDMEVPEKKKSLGTKKFVYRLPEKKHILVNASTPGLKLLYIVYLPHCINNKIEFSRMR